MPGLRTSRARAAVRIASAGRPARLNAVFAVALLLSLFLTVSGSAAGRAWAFLDWGAGVLALVSLTLTALWGLAAADRRLLGADHRLLAQGVHRGTAVAGLGFLVLHVWVKVAEESTGGRAAAVPFTDGQRPVLIGLGTLAGYLFVAVAVTGAARSAFATTGRSRWWRALHMGAYLAWALALVHGLKAGRTPGTWVTCAYVLCVAGAAVVLALRLAPGRNPPRTPGRRTPEARTAEARTPEAPAPAPEGRTQEARTAGAPAPAASGPRAPAAGVPWSRTPESPAAPEPHARRAV
ncbi:hypothetical protein [Streptomyces armeniacus]|uniref:hypothetical protein n=1 Tax=Streptomyces armeniacus TaxID=83291 RepID=UPI001C9AE832|nr:hypothetical protein [Streptomyces armeniacus]